MADAKRARRFDKTLIPPAITTEYVNAIGMMFSLAALLMKVSIASKTVIIDLISWFVYYSVLLVYCCWYCRQVMTDI